MNPALTAMANALRVGDHLLERMGARRRGGRGRLVTAPSGEQIELRAGDQRAVVVEVGAGLREYRHGGHAGAARIRPPIEMCQAPAAASC